MIIKSGAGNYYFLDLNKQQFLTLHFYKMVGNVPTVQTDPTAQWIADNPITDVGAGNLISFIVARVQEYAINYIDNIGDRYVLLT